MTKEETKNCMWLKPELVAQVQFRDWSQDDVELTARTLEKLAESLRTSARATTAGSTNTTEIVKE